ncbi:phosphotransferase [Cellulomonas sp. NPDC055163]
MAKAPTGPREITLEGGTSNHGLVVRVGDTVRRPPPPGAPAVHALLEHLGRVGFDGAPRFLGLDDHGREVLTYIRGDVPIAPYPQWALTDESLASVGRLLRRYHDAVESFDPFEHTWATAVPDRWRGPLVSHNDPNLDNVVFRDGSAVALIDFDLAGPGSRVWDLAIAARLWVPLRDPRDVPAEIAGRTADRIVTLADAYGLPRPERRALLAAARTTHDWCYDVMRRGAQRGQPGYVEAWTPGRRAHVRRGREWLANHCEALADQVVPTAGRERQDERRAGRSTSA